jgi:signal transduction histidine kinase
MSTAAVESASRREARSEDPLWFRLSMVLFSSAVVGALLVWMFEDWGAVQGVLPRMLAWAALVAFADLLPVPFWGGRIVLAMSLPVALAAGLTLDPVAAGLVAFAGSLDVREFRRQVPFRDAIYNRSQVTVCVVAASIVFHAFKIPVTDWPSAVLPAFLAVLADATLNILLVSVAASEIHGKPPWEVCRLLFSDVPVQHVLSYCALGLFGLLLASVSASVGMWGAVGFLAPLVLAHQTFIQTERYYEAALSLERKNRALVDACERMADERRDERMNVAGELHDEVLPPLFNVHLMGQVLRQDLTAGRLLDLDEDLPQLLSATQAAQSAIRDLVRNLRRSSIGTDGLPRTLELLAQQLENAGSPRIKLSLEDVRGSKLAQLLTYQVAREAMNNAARHSRASLISVQLSEADGQVRLVVEDDGVGFDSQAVDKEAHFGLQLLSERVEAGKGRVVVDSKLGVGTTVAATLPLDLLDSRP